MNKATETDNAINNNNNNNNTDILYGNGSSNATGNAAAAAGDDHDDDDDADPVLLRTRSFSRQHRDDNGDNKLIVRNWVASAMIVVAVSVSVLVVAGCSLPSFSLEILGMIGLAVESGREFQPAITHHSVFSMVGLLFREARFLDGAAAYIGIAGLSCLLVGTILVVPILQVACLLYQWFVPLGRKKRFRTSVWNESLGAWQYMEVYLIALFVASWQLGPVSQYMFNAYCGPLDAWFAQMVRYGVIREEDAQCFSVQGSLEPGSFALAAAAVLLALLNSFVTKATRQYEYECECEYDCKREHEHERDCQHECERDCQRHREENERRDSHHNPPLKPLATASGAPNDAAAGGGDGTGSGGSYRSTGTGTRAAAQQQQQQETGVPLRPVPVLFTDTYRWLLRRRPDTAPCASTVDREGATTMDETIGIAKHSPVEGC